MAELRIADDLHLADDAATGRARVGVEHQTPITTAELREQYRARLRAGARDMLDVLIAAHPAALTRGELAAKVGIEKTGGTFSAYLSSLRTNGLADVDRVEVRAADIVIGS